MNKLTTTTRRFFAVLATGLVLTLAACGSGSSSSDAGSKASIDNAKTAYAEIQPGMNKSQVSAIVGTPVVDNSSQVGADLVNTVQWKYDDGTTLQVIFVTGVIKSKLIGKNDATVLVQVY